MLRFFRRWWKYSKLSRLSREFAVHYGRIPESTEALFRQGEEDDRLLGELYSLVEADKECSALMARYNADRQILQQLFSALMKEGAGQWAGKKFIPFWALAEPWTLEYLLRHRSRSFTGGGIGLAEAFHVLVFYQDEKGIEWL